MSQEHGVYVLHNDMQADDVHKIGMTTRTVAERIKEIERTGGSAAVGVFRCVAFFPTSDPLRLEEMLHKHFNSRRIDKGREFFKVTPDDVSAAVSQLMQVSYKFGDEKAEVTVPVIQWNELVDNYNKLRKEYDESQDNLLVMINKNKELIKLIKVDKESTKRLLDAARERDEGVEKLLGVIKNWKERCKEQEKEAERLKTEVSDLEQDKGQLEAKLQVSYNDTQRDEIDYLRDENYDLNERIDTLTHQLDVAEQLFDREPSTPEDVEHVCELVEELQDSKNVLEAEISDLRAEIMRITEAHGVVFGLA